MELAGARMTTPSSKYFQATAVLDALQEKINQNRQYLQSGITEVRLNCLHAFEVCWGDPKDPTSWGVYPPVSNKGFTANIAEAHSRCIYCGVEGGNAEVFSALRRKAQREAAEMHMTDEEMYGVSGAELKKAKAAESNNEPFLYDPKKPS